MMSCCRNHRALLPAIAACLLLLSLRAAPVQAQGAKGRFEQFTKKFAATPDQARVEFAGYIGGTGTEWLVSGGFQPDGTVVLAGVALGPTFDIGVHKVTVLGKDAPAPAKISRAPEQDAKGNPKLDKQGKPKLLPLAWNHENATGFIVRLSADLKIIKSVSRFPWKSAGITAAAVDEQGNIYVTGPASPEVSSLQKGEWLKPSDTGLTKTPAKKIYLARLNPAASNVDWLKSLDAPSHAPRIAVHKDKVVWTGPDLRVFTADGKQEAVTVIPGGITPKTAINPLDGTFARGGEHHWPTGREPYRDPILNIFKPDGKLLYELYNWDGPFVGLDNLRLVSDSAVRGLKYDADGNLLIHAWSDGGNSVMYREPNDIRTYSDKMKGLGFSAYGAGVLSCAYLIKIETKNYKVAGGALWLAFLNNKDKPNSIWIEAMDVAADGSVAIAGKSAWGLVQTGNAIGGGDPAGGYIALLSKNFDSLRFSSAMPACGLTEVAEGQRWGIASGKDRLLFLCGAAATEEVYGKNLSAPAVNGVQKQYGGGDSDGYVVVLDLSAKKAIQNP